MRKENRAKALQRLQSGEGGSAMAATAVTGEMVTGFIKLCDQMKIEYVVGMYEGLSSPRTVFCARSWDLGKHCVEQPTLSSDICSGMAILTLCSVRMVMCCRTV